MVSSLRSSLPWQRASAHIRDAEAVGDYSNADKQGKLYNKTRMGDRATHKTRRELLHELISERIAERNCGRHGKSDQAHLKAKIR